MTTSTTRTTTSERQDLPSVEDLQASCVALIRCLEDLVGTDDDSPANTLVGILADLSRSSVLEPGFGYPHRDSLSGELWWHTPMGFRLRELREAHRSREWNDDARPISMPVWQLEAARNAMLESIEHAREAANRLTLVLGDDRLVEVGIGPSKAAKPAPAVTETVGR